MKLSIFEGPQEDRPMLALLLLLVAVSILSLQDTAVKAISPLWPRTTLSRASSRWVGGVARERLFTGGVFVFAVVEGRLTAPDEELAG